MEKLCKNCKWWSNMRSDCTIQKNCIVKFGYTEDENKSDMHKYWDCAFWKSEGITNGMDNN